MKKVVAAGVLVASGLLLTACGGLQELVGPESEDVISYDVTDQVARMRVESGVGDIVVTGSGRTGIKVTETLHWRGADKPEPEHPVEGDGLTLRYDCPGDVGVNVCSVDYRIEVPRGVSVDVSAGSGDITARGLAATLRLETGAGDIEAATLTAKEATVKTGSGDVEIAFTAPPADAEVDTGSGNATVKVPDGRYAVDADTGAGDQRVDVTHDASAAHKLTISTGSGDVSVLKSTQ